MWSKNALTERLNLEWPVFQAPLPFPAQFSVTIPLEESGDEDVTGLYSGQSAALSRAMPAADLVATLAAETSQRLRAFD